MKAIILAAGLGSRLYPITKEVPKCMVPVNGIPIIDKQISNLVKAGIKDILIVGGYKYDILFEYLHEKYPFIEFINNSRYDQTNNMYSLYLTHEYIENDEFLLMNSDVYYDANVIEGILGIQGDAIACDKNIYMEESMKVMMKDGKIDHISKKISEEDYFAVSIDVYKISKETSVVLFDEIRNTIEVLKDENSWTEVALDKIMKLVNFQPYIINGRWYEIDNHEDLAKAEKLFEGDEL